MFHLTEITMFTPQTIQRKSNGSDFHKSWDNYVYGFGDPTTDFWLSKWVNKLSNAEGEDLLGLFGFEKKFTILVVQPSNDSFVLENFFTWFQSFLSISSLSTRRIKIWH